VLLSAKQRGKRLKPDQEQTLMEKKPYSCSHTFVALVMIYCMQTNSKPLQIIVVV
jgi:hypothetical protein